MLELKVNSHVTRMNRHLPFTTSHDQIFEEYQKDADALDIDTRAQKYLQQAVESSAQFIILTGDAGHGKTHLCRRLLEKYFAFSPSTAREILLTKCDGLENINDENKSSNKKSLKIHKDLSELEIPAATKFIDEVELDDDTVTIVCANEGRLRSVISQGNSEIASRIREVFARSFETGLCTLDGKLHIINLNFQSIAGQESGTKSILGTTIKKWAMDGGKWSKSCSNCSSQTRCPIFKNRELLSDPESNAGHLRLSRLEDLFATVERLGKVVTVREALMSVAYFLTGGLTCEDVHEKCRTNKSNGWQFEYAFYNLIFSNPSTIPLGFLTKRIPVFSQILKLDPGKKAIRVVDDRLLNEANVFKHHELDLNFKLFLEGKYKNIDAANGVDEINTNPTNKKERQQEADQINKVITSLRRRAFFDDDITHGTLLDRLGFKFGDIFNEILLGGLTSQKTILYKSQLLAGLHMIQGVRLASRTNFLYLVDPAFGKATADSAIISRQIPSNQIQVIPMKEGWNLSEEKLSDSLVSSVNWIDRYVIVRFDGGKSEHDDLALDLMAFECVLKAGKGYVAEEFYAHDFQRIRNFLARIAEKGRSEDGQINLFMSGQIYSVSLDEKIIQVNGGQ
jgi:hypothetical protein